MKQKYYDWHKTEIGYMDIIEHFSDSDLVLDVGCGNGWIGKVLRGFNRDVTIVGLDVDLIGLKKAKANENPMLCDSKWLPFRNETFDGIIAKDVLEHLLDPLAAVSEFNRILKEKSIIYISVPDVKSKNFWDDYTHVRPFTKQSLSHLLEDAGFTVEKMWYTASWPGLGIVMCFFKINKLPSSVKLLAKLGIKRQNIIMIATKN